jgi:uncharacterized protein YoxC
VPLAGIVTIVLGLIAAVALASCVTVIAVQLGQTSRALADVDQALATLPAALDGLEPALDEINGSLSRLAAAVSEPVSSPA